LVAARHVNIAEDLLRLSNVFNKCSLSFSGLWRYLM
jgi:predicted DNA-binding transcriptional regulator AlpA